MIVIHYGASSPERGGQYGGIRTLVHFLPPREAASNACPAPHLDPLATIRPTMYGVVECHPLPLHLFALPPVFDGRCASRVRCDGIGATATTSTGLEREDYVKFGRRTTSPATLKPEAGLAARNRRNKKQKDIQTSIQENKVCIFVPSCDISWQSFCWKEPLHPRLW